MYLFDFLGILILFFKIFSERIVQLIIFFCGKIKSITFINLLLYNKYLKIIVGFYDFYQHFNYLNIFQKNREHIARF